jgi:ubiquinone/menaquinone biosynthesis C-methylase UbiE
LLVEVAALVSLLIVIAVAARAYPRVTLARKVSLEGIEDPEVVKAYDRISRMPMFSELRRMFVIELKKRNPAGTLVDVGCGPGYLIAKIAKEIPNLHIIGVDVSDEMTVTASRNLASLGFGERVEFRRGDSLKLPFEDDSVDNIVSTLSLHHWANPKGAILEIYRVLKHGGQLLLEDFRRDPRRLFYWLIAFRTKVAPSFLHTQALRRLNEPMGSLLASHTPSELESIMSGTPFGESSVKGGIGWLFLWSRK